MLLATLILSISWHSTNCLILYSFCVNIENLALSSPRIFWSIIYHYGTDFKHAYSLIFPETNNFEWLSVRKRELSEKAIINAEQQLEKAKLAVLKQQAKNNKNNNSTSTSTSTAMTNDNNDNNEVSNNSSDIIDNDNKNIKKKRDSHETNNNQNTNTNINAPSPSTSRSLHKVQDPITYALNTLLADLSSISLNYLLINYPFLYSYLDTIQTYLSSIQPSLTTTRSSITNTTTTTSSSAPTTSTSISSRQPNRPNRPSSPSLLHFANISNLHEGSLTDVIHLFQQIKKSLKYEVHSHDHTNVDHNNTRSSRNNHNINSNNKRSKRRTVTNDSNNDNSNLLNNSCASEESLTSVIDMSNDLDSDTFSSSPSVATCLTEVNLKNAISKTQNDILNLIWVFLCGGSARLKRALFREQINCPYILSVWKIAPDTLFDNLLKHDNFLETVSVMDHFKPSYTTNNTTNNKNMITQETMSTSSSTTGHTRRNKTLDSSHKDKNDTKTHSNNNTNDTTTNSPINYTLFNREYLRSMCSLAYQLISNPSTEWIAHYKISILDSHDMEVNIIAQEDESVAQYMYRKTPNTVLTYNSPSSSSSSSSSSSTANTNTNMTKTPLLNNNTTTTNNNPIKRNYTDAFIPTTSSSSMSISPTFGLLHHEEQSHDSLSLPVVTRMHENNEWIYQESQHSFIGK